jgi:hypothetical protein
MQHITDKKVNAISELKGNATINATINALN